MKKAILFFMFGVLAWSCTQENNEILTGQDKLTNEESVNFLPSFGQGGTRATETAFERGDEISVFAVDPNTGTALKASGNYADNERYTYDGSIFTAAGAGISISDNNTTGLAYYAVYPYSASTSSRMTFSVNKDQSKYSAYTKSDLCTAYASATTSKEVDLTFSHRLSAISVTVRGANIASKRIQMKLTNVQTQASVNLNDNTFTGIGELGEVIMCPTATNTYEAIIAPQTIAAKTNLLVVTVDGEEHTFYVENDASFQSGKKKEYGIEITDAEIVIFRGDINPWGTEDERLDNVVPPEVQTRLEQYMPIYTGVNPPNVEGCYFLDPEETVFCEDQGQGGYDPGTIVVSNYIQFSNQDMQNNTLDYEELSANGRSYSVGRGAFISGSGNNFSAFFNTVGEYYDDENNVTINYKTALLISGTKTSDGILDFYNACVMVEKNNDVGGIIMNENVFRVFRDQDGISYYANWPASRTREIDVKNGNIKTPWSKYAKQK